MFTDAQKLHEDNPDTFSVFHLEDLQALVAPGTYVKVTSADERFWVYVDAVDDDKVTGLVANDLLRAPFKFGDTVHFELRHIYDVYQEDTYTETEQGNIEGLCPTCNAPSKEG